MENSRLVSFSIICLAVSLVICSSIISRALVNASNCISSGIANCGTSISGGLSSSVSRTNTSANTLISDEDFMSLYDASAYLHVDEDSLRSLIGDSSSGIPYTILGNSCVFSKKALTKWVEEKIAKENASK